jgi:cytoplasmic tRNA 2-thiolation protein 1
MDRVVEQVGKKNNCTFCGVFRRQALDRGSAELGVDHILTGHNADDMAETVLMNSELTDVGGADSSHARRRRAAGALHGRHHAERGHDQALQAV